MAALPRLTGGRAALWPALAATLAGQREGLLHAFGNSGPQATPTRSCGLRTLFGGCTGGLADAVLRSKGSRSWCRGASGVVVVTEDVEKESESGQNVEKGLQSNAEHIGYRVLEKLSGEKIEIESKSTFAVVQVGSHQFKVTSGDAIYVEKLKFADVNEKLALEKVMLLGSRSRTIIGRPVIPEARVLAAVEEQERDAKVIIFKKKRRKNYRRHAGHRQELTRLRILDILGIEEDEDADTKPDMAAAV